MKIEIPELIDGECSGACPGFQYGLWGDCYIHTIIKVGHESKDTPGPSCPGPGVYVLVPEAEEKALRELAEAALASDDAILAFHNYKRPNPDAMFDNDPGYEAASERASRAILAANAALARLRALSSPEIPDNSTGGGK